MSINKQTLNNLTKDWPSEAVLVGELESPLLPEPPTRPIVTGVVILPQPKAAGNQPPTCDPRLTPLARLLERAGSRAVGLMTRSVRESR